MRSLLDVRTEIATLTEDCKGDGNPSTGTLLTSRQLSRIKNRIAFLRIVEKYLEESPDELYIGREISRIENRINKIIDAFDPTQYADPTEPKKEYEKEMGISHLRLQLKTLRFIKK